MSKSSPSPYRLAASAEQFGTAEFAATLKRELAQLPPGSLPLAGDQGGLIDATEIEVTLLSQRADADSIEAVVGVFFTEHVGGCNCSDDPSASNGFCELTVRIDRLTGAARVLRRDGA